MKKFLLWFSFMIISLLFLTTFSNAEAINLSVSSSSKVNRGDKVKVNVAFGKSVGSYTLSITYDSSLFEYSGVDKGTPTTSDGTVKVVYFDTNKPATNASITFTAKKAGTGKFSVSGSGIAPPDASFKYDPINSGSTSVTVAEPPQKSTNNFLKQLQINVEGLNPVFNKNTLTYNLVVPEDIAAINVTAVAEDTSAKVSVSGNTTLVVGANKITIKVTAESGAVRNYTINVTKTETPKSSNANLRNLDVQEYTISPFFDPDITEYTIDDIENSVKDLNIGVVTDSEVATYEIVGNKRLQIGENKIDIVVTAEDGITVKTYSILFNKLEAVVPDISEVVGKSNFNNYFNKTTIQLMGYFIIILSTSVITICIMNIKNRKPSPEKSPKAPSGGRFKED